MRGWTVLWALGVFGAVGCSKAVPSSPADLAPGAGVAVDAASPDPIDASSSVGAGMDGGVDLLPACGPGEVHVSPNGTGNACSCADPCALTTGRDQAKTLITGATTDVVVFLHGADYRLSAPFALTAADSGANGHTIIYRAAPGDLPVLNGAIAVTGFTLFDAVRNIWVAAVPVGTRSRHLFVNGRRATRARGPDAPAGYTKTATGFTLGDASIAAWPDRAQLELIGTQEWKMYRCPVSAVSTGGITVAQPCWNYTQAAAAAGYSFNTIAWMENALELLDTGGEFYLDGAAGKLYYAPRAGEMLSTADVELAVVEKLVDAQGTPAAPIHDVAFEGIAFANATWLGPSSGDGYSSHQAGITPRGTPAADTKPLAAVTFHGAHAVRLTDCPFRHLGGGGLAFEVGAQANRVERSLFEDISSSAVLVGDVGHVADHHPTDPALIVKDNSVTGSYITRAGVEYWDAVGIFVGFTTHTTLSNNELFDLPYTAISVGWGWGSVDVGGSLGYTTPTPSKQNVIKDNIVSHHMRALRDGGGIYTLGSQSGSSITGNFVYNQATGANLYLDNGTQFYSVSGNVVLCDGKQDVSNPDPDRTRWLYIQAAAPVALNNTVSGNSANDTAYNLSKSPDPSNVVASTSAISGSFPAAAALVPAAGSPLRSPEIAATKPATASSVYGPQYAEWVANDGNSFDGWSPAASDLNPWWQVDLGRNYAIDAVEVVPRWAIDQPNTRRNYRVLAASEPTFAAPVVLGAVDGTGLPHRAIFATRVAPPVVARYVRVQKTVSEYFFLGEVRVHGVPAP